MIKVAIPVSGNLLSESYSECSYYEIYKINEEAVVSRKEEVHPQNVLNDMSKWM